MEVSDLGMLRRCLELGAIVTLTERLRGITGRIFVVVHFCQRYGIMNILCFGSAVHEGRR